MHISCIAVATLALTSASSCLAAPLKRDFFGAITSAADNLINSNATLSGIVGTVAQSIENPQLTAGACPESIALDTCSRGPTARLTVINGLSDTQTSLSQIASTASATGNTGVTNLVATGQAGVSSAHQGIDNIGSALVSGSKPSVNESVARTQACCLDLTST